MGVQKSGWRRPEVLLLCAFLLAIGVGTALLLLPGMSRNGITTLDALFTATSAVCVTGLVVVDTGRDFTHSGQAVILGLIQAGGLGIMTFSTLALVMTGKRVALDTDAAIKEQFTPVSRWTLRRLLAVVVGVTLALETAGYFALRPALDDGWSAAFHSESAFCNAGFSLDDTSLREFGVGVRVPVVVLLVLGGLGFVTLLEIFGALWPRRARRRKFSLQTRLVLNTTLLLLGVGTLLLWGTEGGKPGHAFFMSASARTAGFDSVSVGGLATSSLLILMLLMFIGASPGSTGGGIKTTTLALVVLFTRATLRDRDRVEIHGREIPRGSLRRALSVFISALMVVFLGIFLIVLFEPSDGKRFLALAFEVVSAVGTVGLSTGITAGLTTASKLLLCVLMFVGRVGSLSLFLLLIRDSGPSRVRYPQEKVLVG